MTEFASRVDLMHHSSSGQAEQVDRKMALREVGKMENISRERRIFPEGFSEFPNIFSRG